MATSSSFPVGPVELRVVRGPGRKVSSEAAKSRRETQLMVRFRAAGDEAAFNDLYLATRMDLLAWIMRRMSAAGLQGDPGEILQDTFVNIYRYAASFREGAGNTFRAWARTIAANVVRRTRSRRHAHLSYQSLPIGALEPEDQSNGPHEVLTRREQCESLERAWILVLLHYAAAAEQLAPRDREALHMVEVDGLGYAEVAKRLRVRLSNTKMIIFRSRKRIRTLMLAALSCAGSQAS